MKRKAPDLPPPPGRPAKPARLNRPFTRRAGRTFHFAFVLFLVALISALFLAVIWPFAQALLLAALLTGLSHPLHRRILAWTNGRRNLAAAISLLIVFSLILGPVSALIGLVVRQALMVSEQAIPWLQSLFEASGPADLHTWLFKSFPWLEGYLPGEEEFVRNVGNAAQAAGTYLVSGVSAFTTGTAIFILNAFVMFYAMFFFFRDGRRILATVLSWLPLADEEEGSMVERFASITRATVRGTLLIGFIQGSLGGLGFYFAGLQGAAFWGAVMMVLSVLPAVGAALVWLPAVIWLYLSGEVGTAILLGAWCLFVVSTIDNIVRPPLVGRDARMPDLMILVGTLGGLYLFGPIGFIIGPMICGLFLTAMEIYAAVFRSILVPAKSMNPEA